jgi:ribosomal protein S18 acetylase RimI-like enzyme
MAERTQFGLPLLDAGRAPDGISLCAADREALEHVLSQAEAYRRRFTYHKDTAEWADSLLCERDADASRDTVLVVSAGRPVGALELVHDGGAVLTIALLVVIEGARLAGVGRRAVEAIVQSIEAADMDAPPIDTLAIGVETQNTAARAFWERLGFLETSAVGTGTARIANMERWLRSGGDSAYL